MLVRDCIKLIFLERRFLDFYSNNSSHIIVIGDNGTNNGMVKLILILKGLKYMSLGITIYLDLKMVCSLVDTNYVSSI